MTWEEADGKLEKEFSFENFVSAVDFVNKIVELAENEAHHPDVFIHSYNKVKISLFTHSENKITEKDYALAVLIDSI